LRNKAACEVRYVVIFNNGSPTEPNGVSELSLAPPRATVLATSKRSPAEIARKKSREGGGGGMSPRGELLDCARLPLAVAEQDHRLRGAIFFERKCCLLVPCQHTHKKAGGGPYYFL
jgi:hypothetical protein